MDKIEILSSIGLSKWESQTYLALLELGETKTGELSKKAEVPQSKIYIVLDSLIEKGLASYVIKGKMKIFQASDQNRLLCLFKEKEEQLKNVLQSISIKNKHNDSVEIFSGLKAMRVMLASLIETSEKNEEFYGFSTGETSLNKDILDFYAWWGERKRNAGLKDKLLISEKNRSSFENAISKEDLTHVRQKTRYAKISFPGDVAIFRDNVVIFNYENNPTAILIQSKDISEQYKEFFFKSLE